MRRLLLAAVIALVGVLPITAYAQSEGAGQTVLSPAATDPNYPIWLGVGAFAGLVLAQFYHLGTPAFAAIPGSLPVGALVQPEWHVAMSRVYAVGFGVIGAWIADGIYMDW